MKNQVSSLLTLLFLSVISPHGYAFELYKDASSQLNFYGQIRTYFSRLEHQDLSLDADSSRAGISGYRNIYGDTQMFVKFEYNLAGNGGNLTNRQHIIGFQNPEYGSLSLGRMWTVSDDMPDADYSYAYGDKVKLYKSLTYASHDSLIKYVYGNIFTRKKGDFFIATNVGLPENNAPDSSGRKQSLKELFAGYVFRDFKIHGGYSEGQDKNRTYGASLNNNIKNKYYNASLTYFMNNSQAGLTYNRRDLKKLNAPVINLKTDSFALAFEHKIKPQWSQNGWFMLYGGYAYQINESENEVFGKKNLTSIHSGLQYYFNPSTFVYAEYGWIDGTDICFDNIRGNLTGNKSTNYSKDSNLELGFRFYW
ncbi:porin [Salmonella enterica subsp. enterica serovar Abony]|nr:porin [Salmonella enterica subsp. enterica serovar Richmond]EBX6497339.1 porin [Salmonella enterica subsp. enterica serovar Abony]EJB5403155.1 porin [Salmonella enterica]ELH0791645.1 porin [Salmonella enterica]HAK7672437.1 porin [Salmonella enterica]